MTGIYPRMRACALVALVGLVVCACGDNAPGAGPADAPVVDTPAVDTPAIDAPAIDALAIDAAAIDAPPPGLAPMAPLRVLGGGIQSYRSEVRAVIALRDHAEDVVVAMVEDSPTRCSYKRVTSAGTVGTGGVAGSCFARPLGGDRVALLHIPDFRPRDMPIAVVDFATNTRLDMVAPSPSTDYAFASDVRAVGSGFEVLGTAAPGTGPGALWSLDSAGAQLSFQTLSTVWWQASFLPPSTGLRLAAHDSNVLTVIDLASNVSTLATPFDGAPTILTASDAVWLLGTIGGDGAAMPLLGTVATVVSTGPVSGTVDALGRLLVASASASPLTVEVVRLDDTRFDGADGRSRLDPTFGPDGRRLLQFDAPVPFQAHTLEDSVQLDVDGAGHLVVVGSLASSSFPPLFPAIYIGWYQVP